MEGGPKRIKTIKSPVNPLSKPTLINMRTDQTFFPSNGCMACHSLDGGVLYGPPLNDLYMKEVTVVRQGKELTIVADREYITRAITDPDYEKVAEYKSKIMPKPVIPKEDVETLIDYLIKQGEKE